MHRPFEDVAHLAALAALHGVDFHQNAVSIQDITGSGKNSGIVAQRDLTGSSTDHDTILITVPQNLVLSLENVWIYSKADRHLREVLAAAGEYARTARGAILIFLLVQVTHNSTEGKIGVASFFSEYVKFLPRKIPLPTFWADSERGLLHGTSLEIALNSKINSLQQEFSRLRDETLAIDWCNSYWWDSDNGSLEFEDWKWVDAIYRSRALDLPGTGHATVPCIDMANHASGHRTAALYETDTEGNAVLLLRDGMALEASDEVTITYGDDKGACEMLFSYGFLEESTTTAKELFLELEIMDDDPLKRAKQKISNTAPGVRLYEDNGSISWEGPYVWLLCINEEDGLHFQVSQTVSGDKELHAFWKGTEIRGISNFPALIQDDPMKDIFDLRVVSTLQSHLEDRLVRLENSKHLAVEVDAATDPSLGSIMRLRDLEETLMLQAYEELEDDKLRLSESATVRQYLASINDEPIEATTEDDFS